MITKSEEIFMRKQLIVFLSVLGIAGSNAPSQAQVLKGSKKAPTRSESTIKLDKAKQEQNAAAAAANEKDKKNTAETNAAKTNATIKLNKGAATTQKDAQIKGNKSAAESSAAKKTATVKASKTTQSPTTQSPK
jgi:hypothetical protein